MLVADNTIIVGINDHLLFREGWHERTRDERCGVLYRPTEKEATFQMLLPGGDVEIVALLSACVSLSCGEIRGSLLYEGKNLGDFHLTTENWVIRRFPFPHAPSGWVKLALAIHNPFVPNDMLENGDFRLMGLSVASLRADRVIPQES